MNSFSFSDLVLSLKLHMLETYPPGTYIPMSEIPKKSDPAAVAAAKKGRIELNPPPSPLKFDQDPMKRKMNALFPELGLQGFLLVVKRDELKDAENLLQAIRTKLSLCDLLIVEEAKEVPREYRAVIGTISTLKLLQEKIGKSECLEIPFAEWSQLSADKKAKLELWNRLSEIR
jgi:hypothetical protein